MPALLPLFPPTFSAAYSEKLGIVPKIEKKGVGTALPQWLADRNTETASPFLENFVMLKSSLYVSFNSWPITIKPAK